GALQERVIPVFHYALKPGGCLFLGLSETIARHGDLFAPVDKGLRIFRRRDHAPIADIASLMRPGAGRAWQPPMPARPPTSSATADVRSAAGALVLDQFAPPHVVVNRDGDVLHQSTRLGKYLEPVPGAPSRQLLALARRGLRTALRTALRQVTTTNRRVVCPRIEVEVDDRIQAVSVTLAPMPGRDRTDPLYLIVFSDLGPPVTPVDLIGAAEPGDDQSTAQLEQELRELRERLQTTIEEYETTSEELKSANEEMVSVNEELQSTNEELETAKEEQQSVNEELRTVNIELAAKLDELDRANADLRNLFESTRIATLFLDRNMVIRNFTPAVSAIVNLLPTDRGRPLTDFSHRLDQVDLPADVARVLAEQTPIERRVAMRENGPHYLMRVLPYRTAEGALDGVVLTFIDVSGVVEAEILSTMVAELNHRVRNMLQVVLAVFQRTLHTSTSLEEFGKTFRGRMQALARAHELVSATGWTRVALRDLVQKEIEPYAEGLERIRMEGGPVALSPRIALSLGMALHELATNASKYGALSVAGGLVVVAWSDPGGAAPRLRLTWTERDGPPVTAPKRRGFGSELIERTVQHDLHGSCTLHYAAAGVRAELEFPLDREPAA
ncbi:MAG: PAS domain-containing protein, partial [Paracraurococcus sp.]